MLPAVTAPADTTWVVSVHVDDDGEPAQSPVGSGVLLDRERILTASHVLDDARGHWVRFAKAETSPTPLRKVVEICRAGGGVDAALLRTHPLEDEPSLQPAKLYAASLGELEGCAWWSFGFPEGDEAGSPASGQIKALTGGRLRLECSSKYTIAPGFSGAPVWAPDYEAVVGIVIEANMLNGADPRSGDGRGLTFEWIVQHLPEARTPDSGRRPARPTSAGTERPGGPLRGHSPPAADRAELTRRARRAETPSSQGDLQEAERLHREVLHERLRMFGPEDRDTLISMTRLARTLAKLRELEQARDLYERALEVHMRKLGPGDAVTRTTMSRLTEILASQGDREGVRRLVRRAEDA